MFGSIRTLCAATSKLEDFPMEGIHWGDCESLRDLLLSNQPD